jgi:hypothetical protein
MARKKEKETKAPSKKNVADKALSAAAYNTTVLPSDAEKAALTAAAATTTNPTSADDKENG